MMRRDNGLVTGSGFCTLVMAGLVMALTMSLAGCGSALLSKIAETRTSAESPTIAVSIGVAGAVQGNGQILDFKALPYDASQTLTITIHNIGKSALVLKDGITLSPGANTVAGEFTVASAPGTTSPLAINTTGDMVLAFTPTSQGSKNVTISIPSNDVNQAIFSFSVTCTWNSDAKDITDFYFTVPFSVGVISGTDISVVVPRLTSKASLVASFTTSGKSVAINGVSQTSGVGAVDFTSPITYTVSAADGTTKNFKVTITVSDMAVPIFSSLPIKGPLTASSVSISNLYISDYGLTGATMSSISGKGVCIGLGSSPDLRTSEQIVTNTTNDNPFDSSISNLTGGTLYYMRAYATNVAGTGFGLPISFTTPLAQPAAPTLVAGVGTVAISWPAVSGATSYKIMRNATLIATVSSPTLSYTDTSVLVGNTDYTYIITANTQAYGDSAPSSSSTVRTYPAAPTAPSVVPGTNSLTVSWTAPVGGATSYNLYWRTASGVTTTNSTKIPGATSGTVYPGIAGNVAVYYVVTAVNASGESPASAEVYGYPIPQAPVASSARLAGNGNLLVSWTAPGNAAASYKVYYATTSGNVKASCSTPVETTGTSCTLTNLTNGTMYYVAVTGLNTSSSESEVSNEINGVPHDWVLYTTIADAHIGLQQVNTTNWTSAAVTTPPMVGANPTGMAADGTGKYLFHCSLLSDGSNNGLFGYRIDQTSGALVFQLERSGSAKLSRGKEF